MEEMSWETAGKVIGKFKARDGIDSVEKLQALMKALDAIDKQIPAKENKNRNKHICPKCSREFRVHVNYCSCCGQALENWDEDDNDNET